jgi:AcrR family transcriptional regulator
MGTLYRRFATKDDLITALADELQDEILQEIARIADEQPDGRGLEAVLWSMGEHLAAHHGCLGLVWPVLTSDSNPGRARMWQLIGQLLTQAQRAGEVRGDLTLTDVYLCAASLRALIDETAGPAPSIWRRHLALLLVAFRPSATPLAHRPADDSLVERGLPAAFRDGDQPLRRAGR